MERKIIFYNKYFIEFYLLLNAKEQRRIDLVLDKVKSLRWLPEKYFRHLGGTDGLYEIKIASRFCSFRIFCCFDSNAKVILFNAFNKKSNRTPKRELDTALRLKKEYFNEKSNEK